MTNDPDDEYKQMPGGAGDSRYPRFVREERSPSPEPAQYSAAEVPYEASEEIEETEDFLDDEDVEEVEEGPRTLYRGATSDPVFGFLIAAALAIGLMPLISSNAADMRYTVSWGVLAVVGVLGWLLGNGERIGQEKPENIAWGVVFGLLIGAPFFAFGGPTLQTAVHLLFPNMTAGTVLAFLIFVMPMSETLFFRGILQQNRPFWVVGLWSSVWSMILFFPLLDISTYPLVAFVIAVALVMVNVIYSYVRQRNGLAAAWICQIVMNLVMVFLPFLQ